MENKIELNKPENIGFVVTELISVTAVSLLSIWGFSRISSKLQINLFQPFKTDLKIINFLSSIESRGLTKVMEGITTLANFKGITVVAGAVSFAFFRSK